MDGQAIAVPPKQMTPLGVRYWMGGTIFGLGWGLLGACPGPMFALIGAGVTSMTVAVLSALAGTWIYIQHTYWVYVPAQYDAKVSASLMIFNDGQAFK